MPTMTMKRYSTLPHYPDTSHLLAHYPDPSQPPNQELLNDLSEGSKRCRTNQSFESLFDSETLSDVCINVNNSQFSFNAHKMILSMKSETLALMINDAVKNDNEKPVVYIHESKECSEVFSRFLYFIYSGAIWLHREYVLPLHQLALKYGVKALVHHCENFILQILHNSFKPRDETRSFSVETVVEIYQHDGTSQDIKDLSLKVLCSNIKDLTETQRWVHCSCELVSELLKSDHCIAEENYLLTAATNWMKKNNLSEKERIEDILTNIRYPLLNRRVLYHLQKNNAFKNFPRVQELMTNAIRYHCFKDIHESQPEFVGKQFEVRHFVTPVVEQTLPISDSV